MSAPVHVVLGPTYMPTMWDLAKRVRAARAAHEPVIVIQVGAPINSETVEAAILSDSLYFIGVRPSDGVWREFEPDDARANPANAASGKPRLPGSRWIKAGAASALSSYRALRLPWLLNDADGATGAITYAGTTLDLIRFFRQWEGDLGRHDAQVAMLALIFILCESLRFRSIERICRDYIWPIGGMPADPVARPVLTITRDMLKRVQEWDKMSRGTDPDVQTPAPGCPDPLFT